MKTKEQLASTISSLENDKELDCSKIKYVLGCHNIEDFKNADVVIKNPGVKYEGNKFLAVAKQIETDLSMFLHFTKAPIIAVTGSKGKSSTVSAIHYGLSQAGFKTFLGGNITVSPLTFFDKVNESTPVVIEFSSWQLSDLRGRKVLKPFISIITKIVPDHLNWYGNMKDYVSDKQLIYADQTSQDFSIFDYDDDEKGTEPENASSWGNLFSSESKATVLRYSKNPFTAKTFGVWQDKDEDGNFVGKVLLPQMNEPEIVLKELSVPGEHMKANALNAALVLSLMNVPSTKIQEILKNWQGINHRLQFFHSWKNQNTIYKFYNDSCATVPEAAAAATQAFGKEVILLTGGTDKGLELNPLIDVLTYKDSAKFKIKKIYLLEGTATDKLLPHLNKAQINYNGPFNNLKDLICTLRKDLENENPTELPNEEIVVFSPGATSFGMFANEFDRGEKLMKGIKEVFN
jgi:UDP-N-acetylmuramoylalanine--D-glutamate ligase